MKNPVRAIVGNLTWTRTGTVWAHWRLDGLAYGYRQTKDKQGVRQLHTALFRALPGESLLLGVSSGLDPAVIVNRMLDGIDLEQCPQWVEECAATLDSLDQIGIGQRVYWLSVPLAAERPMDRITTPLRAAYTDLRENAGLALTPPPAEEIERRIAQAARIETSLPAPFQARPVTAAQMVWLHEHAVRRGMFQDLDLPESVEDVATELLSPRSGAALLNPVLDEGGKSDLDKVTEKLAPWSRRFLKVIDVSSLPTPAPSYQVLQAISDVPDGGVLFPGGEVLGRIDESGVEVDWAMRLTIRSSHEVQAMNNRALRNLNEQYSQRSLETSHALNQLDKVSADLAEYVAILDSDKLEVEAQATMIFAVAGPSPDIATQAGRALADWFHQAGYKLTAPLGGQEDLWWAMTPGVASTQLVRELGQVTTSAKLAALVPVASTRLGDTSGSVLALNITNGPLLAPTITCGPCSVVMHDIEGSADRQMSGSMAIAGELGAGKTATLMKLAGDVVDRQGQIIISDRTAKAEWAEWARGMDEAATVIDAADPQWSMDPLRVFGARSGSPMMLTFLTPLLNVQPTSARGVLLADVLDPRYLAEHHLDSAGAWLAHLQHDCDLEGAGELARLVNVFARRDYGAVVFNSDLPAFDPGRGAIVFLTRTLALPNREELETQHLFEQLGPEKLFGRALNALVGAISRHICFADTSRLAAFVVSEAHAMTASFEGERELTDIVRDGRKHRAVALVDTHDPLLDFSSPALRGLIPTRLLMRHRDKTLAQHGLEWLDLDPHDENLLELITKDTSPLIPGEGTLEHRRGEGLLRDMSARVGRVKVLLPAREERARAITAGGTARARTTTARTTPAPTTPAPITPARTTGPLPQSETK